MYLACSLVFGPRAYLNVSEKVTVPTFKVMAEVDKYFELSSHPGSGAMVIHSVEGNTATLSTVSHITGCHACDFGSSMWHPAPIRSWSVVMMNLPFQSLR
jgi:hypothetical protein